MQQPFYRYRAWLLGLLLIGISAGAGAAPYTPADGGDVLEQLPFNASDTTAAELRGLRRALTASPRDAAFAERVARRYIQQSRLDSDPRYLGYAEAALKPWWKMPEPPVGVLVLRAVILQARHQFGAALTDLDQAVRRQPGNAQAWLTRAAVEQAQGDYQAARKSCFALAPHTSTVVSYGCLMTVTSLNGAAQQSYVLLQLTLQQSPTLTPDLQQWTQGLLADMAARRGDGAAAERHYRAALAAARPDSFLLAAYADFLLDQGRAAEVVTLLRDQGRADALLLRLALAEDRLKLPDARQHSAELGDRFAASRLRGDALHRREQARYELALRHDTRTALQLAIANWEVQREPADARIVLESALAAHAPAQAQPVLNWLRATRLEDVQLRALVQRLESLS